MPDSTQPALDELRDKLKANGVEADPVRIGAAILGVVRDFDRSRMAAALQEWVEQWAVDIATASKRHSK